MQKADSCIQVPRALFSLILQIVADVKCSAFAESFHGNYLSCDTARSSIVQKDL